jgi:DNA-binding NtrC family response regulator
MPTILIVDDDLGVRKSTAKILAQEGYEVQEQECGEDALRAVEKSIFDVVISDLRMKAVDGIEVLRRSKAIHPDTIVLMMTAHATVDSAVAAMREGAYDYITKPVKPDELILTVAKALEHRAMKNTILQLERRVKEKFSFDRIIAVNPKLVEILRTAAAVAATDSTILITGESGTGKELIAGAIHCHSNYRQGPFITVNCGALPEHLLESELFGHVKGAFTGAICSKRGLVEAADNGSLFLDEIGEMSPAMQIKLLRFLESGEFRRVGETKTRYVKVRLLVATNRDLHQAIKQGAFREDLFYRINVIPLHVPPLRERRDELPRLCNHFLRQCAEKIHKPVTGIAKEAMTLLIQHDWPGNVRELINTIEHGVTLCTGDSIQIKDLPPRFTTPLNGTLRPATSKGSLAEIEKNYILSVLQEVNWNQAAACKILELSKTTLYRRLKEYGIDTRMNGDSMSD